MYGRAALLDFCKINLLIHVTFTFGVDMLMLLQGTIHVALGGVSSMSQNELDFLYRSFIYKYEKQNETQKLTSSNSHSNLKHS